MNANFMPKKHSRMTLASSPRSAGHIRNLVAAAGGLVLLSAALWPLAARADKSDRFQPLNFAADNARVDDNQRLNILSGNVEITKGSIMLRAERVEVRQGPDGTQNAVATGGPNGRSLFRQRRDGLDEAIEGEAERVEYDGRADVVRFTGRAVMRRLQGATVADEVVGQAIIYDNRTEVFQVVGGAGSAASSGRVRGVIAPRKESPAAPAPQRGSDAAPATGADGARLSTTRTLSRPDLESTR